MIDNLARQRVFLFEESLKQMKDLRIYSPYLNNAMLVRASQIFMYHDARNSAVVVLSV